jgi:hypothetical protein
MLPSGARVRALKHGQLSEAVRVGEEEEEEEEEKKKRRKNAPLLREIITIH